MFLLGKFNKLLKLSIPTNLVSHLSYLFFHPSFDDSDERKLLSESFTVKENFITVDEERSLELEAQSALKRLRYEADHWDSAILGYRETEKKDWNEANHTIIQRVKSVAFTGKEPMSLVHVLDLKADGEIKPHVDSVKFCGSTIAGLSLLTNAVMRLAHEQKPHLTVDVFLSRRSLYIMTGASRYKYRHAILVGAQSKFNNQLVEKGRRISVICRNEPDSER